MRDIEKEIFINNFDINDYNQGLVNSIEDFEAKIKGEAPIDKKELMEIIEGTEEIRFVDTSEITDMSNLFKSSKYETLDLSRWNTSNVKHMSNMFDGCRSLKELDLSNFDTSKVKGMSCMFFRCESLKELDISSFNTSSVEDMIYMFHGCKSLKELDLSSFDTSSVENMEYMFNGCRSLVSLDLSIFDTSKVKDMSSMFNYCDLLKDLNLSNFDTSKVTGINGMFAGCSSLEVLDLSNFDTSKVLSMYNVFSYCKSLKELDLSSFDFSVKRSVDNIFEDCNSIVFDLKELGVDLELVEKMNIPCFKYDLEDSNLEKTHTLDSDLLELTFLDNDVGMVFIKHLEEKGSLEVYKMNDDFHLVKSNSEGYSVNKEQMEKLEESGVLMEIEKPKVKNRRKNKM